MKCFLKGCLGLFVLGTILTCGGLVGGYFYLKNQVVANTSTAPRELPKIEYTQEELKSLSERVETFQRSVKEERASEQLVLTADDINALIGQNKDLQGRLYVKINDGKVSADLSVPADFAPGGGGRYFNGSITADVALENGVLVVNVSEAEVNGLEAPETFMQPIRQENLAKDLNKDPKIAEVLSRFESLTIENDKIILKPRPKKETE